MKVEWLDTFRESGAMTDQTSRGQSIDGVKILAYLPPKLELPFSKALTVYLKNKS